MFLYTDFNSLDSGVYEAIVEGITKSVVKFPFEPGKSYILFAVAVDNVGNRQSLQDTDQTIITISNGTYLHIYLLLLVF